jgi:hypothetical protein
MTNAQRANKIEEYVRAHWQPGLPEECSQLDGDIDCSDRAHFYGPSGNYLTPVATITVDQMCDTCKLWQKLYVEGETIYGKV